MVLFFWLIPADCLAGRIALGITTLGVLATFVIEVPIAWRVHRGAGIPRGAAYSSAPGHR